jgi:hypothetical protein
MTRALAAAFVAALACAGTALAKGPVELRICGASDCREFKAVPGKPRDAELVFGLVNAEQSFDFVGPPPLGRWYELTLRADWYEWSPLAYAADAGVVAQSGNWIALDRRTLAAVRRATSGLQPKPRPAIERALVNGLPSANPAVYAGVFGPLPPAPVPPPGTPVAEIRLVAGGETPWTDGRRIEYFPAANVLRRSGEWVRTPRPLANRIENDLTSVGKDADGVGWPAVLSVLVLAGGLVLAGWATLGRRRRVARALRPARD